MNFDDLKGLTSSGAQAASVETPKPVAVAPAPASEPIASVADAATVHADPYAPVAAPVPAAKPSSVPELPNGAVPLFLSDGTYTAIRTLDGQYITVTNEKPADPLAGLSASDQEPINWDDEQRLDLPQRTPGRVQFLLLHETKEQREARIQNDLMRGLTQQKADTVPFDPEKTAGAQSMKKWLA
jgi:hypothetical protein